MIRTLIAPVKYVQGRNVLNEAGGLIEPLGKKLMILASEKVKDIIKDTLLASLQRTNLDFEFEKFNGECSRKEIERVSEILKKEGFNVIAGAGGGKTLDTAKASAHKAGIPVVILPTIASTDAPISAIAVVYTPEGGFEEYRFFPRNPDLVLVDTLIIAQAPVRFFVSGMGDALATWFEADAVNKAGAENMAGGHPTSAALRIAKLCYENLLKYGLSAKLAVEKKCVTEAVEKIVEANTLLSGIGFESGGLAAAHSIHDGMTALQASHRLYHGEKVIFGLIAQLVMENCNPNQINEVLDFCIQVGLPVCFDDLGLGKVSQRDLEKVVRLATAENETIHNEPFSVTEESVLDALLTADALGSFRKKVNLRS